MNEALYTAEEVAEYLKIDVRVVRRKAAQKQLEGYKLGGKNWRFTEGQIKIFLKNCASNSSTKKMKAKIVSALQ